MKKISGTKNYLIGSDFISRTQPLTIISAKSIHSCLPALYKLYLDGYKSLVWYIGNNFDFVLPSPKRFSSIFQAQLVEDSEGESVSVCVFYNDIDTKFAIKLIYSELAGKINPWWEKRKYLVYFSYNNGLVIKNGESLTVTEQPIYIGRSNLDFKDAVEEDLKRNHTNYY